MNIVWFMGMSLLGMGFIAACSFGIYSVLPRSAWYLAEKHGRYAGLGATDVAVNHPLGNRPAPSIPQFQGQSA